MKRLRFFIGFVGLLTILGGIAAGVFFLTGMFNVAANEEDPALVKWALEFVRTVSISRHASEEPPPISLADQKLIEAGAKSYRERGCVQCHGGPGVDESKFADGLNPSPPDLKELADKLSPQEVFWVVKNGIRMTGMPSFGAAEVPDQELWSIVAFVKKLPMVSESDYKAWSQTPADAAKP
jgi:mono/diheme cytochrome c family protein